MLLEEEAHELGAGRELARRSVSIVAVRRATWPCVAATFDGEESDFGSAAGEADLVNGR